jgi:hypothetical protein
MIVIIPGLQRKLPDQKVERLRERVIGLEAEGLRLRLEKWVTGEIPILRDARPALPEELNDRQQDGAEILLAIADAAGGDWLAKARRVLVELYTGENAQDDSDGVQLLRDIRGIFQEGDRDKITSAELIEKLKSIETSPWGEWNRGKGLTFHGLGHILKRFGIASGTIRVADSTLKGYVRERFADAFSRFLPPPMFSPGSQSATPPQCSFHEGPDHVLEAPQVPAVTDQESEAAPVFKRVVADVADQNTKTGIPVEADKGNNPPKILPSCRSCGSYYLFATRTGYCCETCGATSMPQQ